MHGAGIHTFGAASCRSVGNRVCIIPASIGTAFYSSMGEPGLQSARQAAAHSQSAPPQVWGLEAVAATVDFKWRRWAHRLVWAELLCYLLWLVGF